MPVDRLVGEMKIAPPTHFLNSQSDKIWISLMILLPLIVNLEFRLRMNAPIQLQIQIILASMMVAEYYYK